MSATAPFDLPSWSAARQSAVEQALTRWVSVAAIANATAGPPAALVDSMRYAVLDGGKRLRPLLVLAAAEAVSAGLPAVPSSAAEESVLRAA